MQQKTCCLDIIHILLDKIRLTTKDDDYPIMYRVLTTIPNGAGFLNHQQLYSSHHSPLLNLRDATLRDDATGRYHQIFLLVLLLGRTGKNHRFPGVPVFAWG